jgi:hypothetical protein
MRLIPRFASARRGAAFNLAGVELQIEPEPSPAEREAIEVAIAQLLASPALPAAYLSGWRSTGIAENVEAG